LDFEEVGLWPSNISLGNSCKTLLMRHWMKIHLTKLKTLNRMGGSTCRRLSDTQVSKSV